jgi:hypothetical protein
MAGTGAHSERSRLRAGCRSRAKRRLLALHEVQMASGSRRASAAALRVFQPARERLVTGQRQLAVGCDPVAHAELSQQDEWVARTRPVVNRECARLDPPAPRLQRRERDALLGSGHGERMRPGAVHGLIFRTPGDVAARNQRPRQILDPAARLISFLVRRPSDAVQVDRRESLERAVHFVGERSRDVFEAAAIRLVISHGDILAASPALQRVDNPVGVISEMCVDRLQAQVRVAGLVVGSAAPVTFVNWPAWPQP